MPKDVGYYHNQSGKPGKKKSSGKKGSKSENPFKSVMKGKK